MTIREELKEFVRIVYGRPFESLPDVQQHTIARAFQAGAIVTFNHVCRACAGKPHAHAVDQLAAMQEELCSNWPETGRIAVTTNTQPKKGTTPEPYPSGNPPGSES